MWRQLRLPPAQVSSIAKALKGEHLLIEQWCHWHFQLGEVKEPLQRLTPSARQEGVWQRLEKILLDEELRDCSVNEVSLM